LLEGDETAFETLVRKYQHSVANTIYRYTGDSTEAEDLSQQVFIKVWSQAKTFKGKSKFSTWLYRIVVNQCLNYKAKRKREAISLDELIEKEKIHGPESLRPDIDFENRKKVKMIQEAINGLPKNQRLALILSKLEGKSYKEVAQIMGFSVSAIESLLFRAKQNLKQKLLPLRKQGEI